MTCDNDPETSKEFQDALDGDRESALAMWRLVAENPQDWEAISWVKEVAARILKAEQEEDRRRRPDAILKSVGLGGRKDPYRVVRQHIRAFDGFENLDRVEPAARGEKWKARFKFLRALPEFREAMRENGLTDLDIDDLADHEIRKFVGRISKI